ncbi:MAG: tRNA (adenosine(37)-N6)-threonylcarbamoyltransferase complex ATPase subunit type 1 TsaE [Candidatus Buchananbacteria bacterium]
MKIISLNDKQTLAFGKKFAQTLRGGEVLALAGELGSGKTVFAKGLALGLAVEKMVTSPTFVLMKVYSGQLKNRAVKLAHLDAYRLNEGGQLLEIGLCDFLGKPDCITVIEWAERVKDILPAKVIWLRFKLGSTEKQRQIIVEK